MSEVVRLYRYKSLLSSRRAVSAEDLMAALEVSRATLKRDIAKLRDQLHVPIQFDRDLGGYRRCCRYSSTDGANSTTTSRTHNPFSASARHQSL